MAVNDVIKLTRDQIREAVGGDPQIIKQFENLIANVNAVYPEDSTETAISLIATENKVGGLESSINELIKSINGLALKPVIPETNDKTDESLLNPLVEKNAVSFKDYYDFTKSFESAHRVGRMCWNLDQDTLNIHHPGGVLQQVGQEQYIRFLNNTGVTISNGTLLGIDTVGGTVVDDIGPYIADATLPINYVLGVATQDVEDQEYGRLTTFGAINDIDTTGTAYGETWAVGDILYASPTIAGGFTNVKPTAPNWSIPLAIVITVDSTQGSFFVRVSISDPYYYAKFTRNTSQSIAAINTAYELDFDTTEITNGVYLELNNRIRVPQSGLYEFTLVKHLQSGSSSAKNFWSFFRKNGTDINNSSIVITLNNSNDFFVLSRSFTISLDVDDYVQVMYAGDSTNIIIEEEAATAFSPATPACILFVKQVAQ